MVVTWPAEKIHKETWLGEYARLRRQGLADGDEGRAATTYYAANREAMDAGWAVSWDTRHEADELSAKQNAYNLLIDRGEAVFFSEYQNEPVEAYKQEFEISPDVLCSRLYAMPRFSTPTDCHWLVAAVDINYSGLHWVAAGWRSDLAGYVTAHGNYTAGRATLIERKGESEVGGEAVELTVYKAITALTEQLAATTWRRGEEPWQLDVLAIDCGFWSDTVLKACKALDRRHGFRVLAVRGRGSKDFRLSRSAIGQPGDRLYLAEWPGKGYVVELDGDYHRMGTQKSFLLPVGAPGALALYGDRQAEHIEFAKQVVAERLVEFVHTDVRDYYTWDRPPGTYNDWGDALTYCRVLAQFCGASPLAGATAALQQQNEQRKYGSETTTKKTNRRWW
ncbi:MAG: phage terminase large subunit family protein [Acidobacteriales bacterium]|nr:phage terminase large subunit family protein [Terriglobales bacterium]